MIKRNKIDEITISIPLDQLTDNEQMTLLAVYVRQKSSPTNHSVLPTAVNTDDEKIKQVPDHQPTSLPILTLLEIRSQILTIRTAGKYNMFDAPAVQREAYELGFCELVVFIEEHNADYAHFILTGDLPGLPLSLYPLEGSEVVLEEMPDDPNPVAPAQLELRKDTMILQKF